jgi:hypothetical protein
MTGYITGSEYFVRSRSPKPFFENEKILAQTAEDVRRTALGDLDRAGAYSGPDFGKAIERVVASADATVKRITAPIFEYAAQQNVTVDMRPTVKYLAGVLHRDLESGGSFLEGEIALISARYKALAEEPFLSAAGAQDFIKGRKAAQRMIAGAGAAPSPFLKKVWGDVIELADKSYLDTLKTLKDPALVRDLLQARRLYRETLTDLYSDATAIAASKAPEDVGRALTAKGTVTEIRELRTALDRTVTNAPERSRYRGQVSELGKETLDAERARIDAGLIKGFLEKNTQSLTDLPSKLRDPDFKVTLKELLTGEGVANPVLGKKVLESLDRVAGLIKLAQPEIAPRPGRVGPSGMGGVGMGTTGAAATGGSIQTAVPLVYSILGITKLYSTMVAKALTTGNLGAIRTLERALALAPIAGKNAAAAETLNGLLREIDTWDRQHGGTGLSKAQP